MRLCVVDTTVLICSHSQKEASTANNYRGRKKKGSCSQGKTTFSLLFSCNYVASSCSHVLKKLFGVQTSRPNCWMVWGNVSFTSCMNAECFYFTIDCCWEQNMLIEGAKMSSIEGLDFRCCQQTNVISAEVLSIHQTLNTVAADDRSIEVNFEVTMNQMLYMVQFPAAGEHLSFCLTWTSQ